MSKNNKENSVKKSDKGKRYEKGSYRPQKASLGIKEETKHAVLAVAMFALALFFILSAFGRAGVVGNFFHNIFIKLFGMGYFLVPVICSLLGVSFIRSVRPNMKLSHTLSSLLFLLSGLGIMDIATKGQSAGFIGRAVAVPFVKLFDIYTSILFLGAFLVISLLVLFDAKPKLMPLFSRLGKIFKRKRKSEIYDYEQQEEQMDEEEEPEEIEEEAIEEEKPTILTESEESEEIPIKRKKRAGAYVPPPLSLLEEDKGKPNVGDIKANQNIIRRTLQNFGIIVEMDEITIGPTVTRYTLKPAEGVKLSRIMGLQNELALALAAQSLRIEAPIPGKSLVGIEIPNKVKSTVGLGTLLSDEKFSQADKPLMTALGREISGRSLFGNLAKMPHLLVAGTTGSGKSVTIHSIITSLLYRNGPEDLKLILVDPKRVELTLYNKIPHLLTPVITDAKKAILSLKWAAKEMDRRYDILQQEMVRDISSYHEKLSKEDSKRKTKEKDGESASEAEGMPYIVIIIDELADIMSTYPRELESAIVRLAQMSRAVGIHLIISTQRPSVNVITGLIKANIPARIALQVSSQIDSRTILDEGGAEKLLGAGDMLYLSGDMPASKRLQSAFISEQEVKKVVKYLADNYKDEIMAEINLTGGISADKSIFESTLDDESGDEEDDEVYEEARQIVIQAGKASTSYLQRKLRVGYARAARLIDMLEERGVVGPGEGAKPREVIEKPIEAEKQGFN